MLTLEVIPSIDRNMSHSDHTLNTNVLSICGGSSSQLKGDGYVACVPIMAHMDKR